MEKNKESVYKDDRIEWGGWLNEFLWICAGANRDVLRQCPTDYAKYAGIGGTILFTALMAMLSGGYALFTVFKNQSLAALFGFFWGLLIFNLDRFIVNTMYSDGKVTISWREFYSGLPRIVMAIFLGIVISTPLELKIYEDGIDNEIEHMKAEELEKRTERLDNEINELKQRREDIENRDAVSAGVGGFSATNSQLGQQLTKLQGEQRTLSDKIRDKQQEIKRYSPVNSPKMYQSCSQTIRQLQNQRAKITRDIHEIEYQLSQNNAEYASSLREADAQKQKEIASINERIEKLKNSIDDKNDTNIKKLEDELTGFQGRMLAFERMKDKELSTRIASLFIALLFIVIETTPTFFKMMIASGPYDDFLRAEMHRVRVLSDKRISDLNDDVNTEVQISTQRNKVRLETEVLANKKLMDRIAEVQAELLQTAIDKWREEELAKINEDPSAYIKTNNVS
jgi:hypothetical protein